MLPDIVPVGHVLAPLDRRYAVKTVVASTCSVTAPREKRLTNRRHFWKTPGDDDTRPSFRRFCRFRGRRFARSRSGLALVAQRHVRGGTPNPMVILAP
jgi:hypothetical protein